MNKKAVSLSQLSDTKKTIQHDYGDHIPVFLLEETNLQLKLNRSANKVDFIDVKYNELDKLCATLEEPQDLSANFEQIGVEQALQAQHENLFCAELRRRINEVGVQAFVNDENVLLVGKSDKRIQIFVPHSMKERTLYINHHSMLASHP